PHPGPPPLRRGRGRWWGCAGDGGGRPGPLATFSLLYVGCLLFWPGLQQGTRFLLPIIPGYFLYVMEGGWRAWRRWPRARGGLVALAAAVAISFGGRYTRLDWVTLRSGPGTAAAQELFAYVRAELPRDAVLLFRKPRALALFTGRGATMYDDPAAGTDLGAWVRTAGVTHVAVGRGFDLDRAALAPWIARNEERLDRLWGNGEFEVWRVR
ncbi:MAG: hypothetical protein HZA54_02240, partial [Planctomycetes bacterium]|nr:hypothetical protein [Planctomycetota bacterium]